MMDPRGPAAARRCACFLLCAATLLLADIGPALAQRSDRQPSALEARLRADPLLLPEAPTPQTPAAVQTASIYGTVLDVSGAAVPNAHVTLVDANGHDLHVILSGPQGEFRFDGLDRGPFRVAITATGLEPFVSAQIVLAPRQTHELTGIALPIATANTEVQVTLTIAEIATEQVKAEEKQRAFGVLPNFYTSYIYNAAPLNPRQKFSLAAHSVFDPTAFLGAAIGAGVGQGLGLYEGYGYGFSGYAKRYAAGYGDELTGRVLGSAVFPALFHQDPRYFYQGSGSIKSRALHAVASAVITRTDSGHHQLNYSYVFGDLSSGALSNLYYPHADRGTGLIFLNTAFGVGGHAVNNLIREFVSKSVTTNIPVTSNGKAPAAAPLPPARP